MTQNSAQLYLHINRLHQKCKLQSEEILKAYDNCADNKRSNICIAEGFELSSVSGNSFLISKTWKRQVYASLINDRQILSIFFFYYYNCSVVKLWFILSISTYSGRLNKMKPK